MALIRTDDKHYNDIAQKVRDIKGTGEMLFPSEMAQAVQEVYDKGLADGQAQGGGENPLYYATNLSGTFNAAKFPENYSLTIHLANTPNNLYQAFAYTKNLKSIKIITDDKESLIPLNQTFRGEQDNSIDVETIDLTECSRNLTNIDYMCYLASKLKSILGALDLSNCTSFNYSFFASNLVDIEIVPNTIKANIRFSSNVLSDLSKQSIIDGLAQTETLLQLDLQPSVINSLSVEQQTEILLKNWEVI